MKSPESIYQEALNGRSRLLNQRVRCYTKLLATLFTIILHCALTEADPDLWLGCLTLICVRQNILSHPAYPSTVHRAHIGLARSMWPATPQASSAL